MKLAQVEALVAELPGVTTGIKWGQEQFLLGDKGFVWRRPLRASDLRHYGEAAPPRGDIVAVRVESLDAKDAILAMELPGFFTIPHFDGYPGLLIELRLARVKDVRAVIVAAHGALSARLTRPRSRRVKAGST